MSTEACVSSVYSVLMPRTRLRNLGGARPEGEQGARGWEHMSEN